VFQPRLLCLVFIFLTLPFFLIGQDILDAQVSVEKRDQSLSDFLFGLENKIPAKFFFKKNWIENIRLDSLNTKMKLSSFLQKVLNGTDVNYKVIQNYYIILIKDPTHQIERDRILTDAASKGKLINRIVVGNRNSKKLKVTLKGKIVDFKNQGPLGGVNIIVDDGLPQSVSDQLGNYELTIPSGSHVIVFSSSNYQDQYFDADIFDDYQQNVTLSQPPVLLEEVLVLDEATKNISKGSAGISSLKMPEIKRMPTFLGEIDVVKQVQTQAGVTTVGEVAMGYNVRGGGVDQNLILLDGSPIFNVSHVFGLLTAFNSESVKSIDFFKGGIPSEYGGRVSSVLKVITKEGDNDEWHGGGGLGILTSHISLGGPIKTDTSTLYFSFRSTYSDWLLHAINTTYGNLKNSAAGFYDANLKFVHKFSNKGKLVISGYTSHDEFRLTNDSSYSWRTITGSVRYDHSYNAKLFTSLSLGYGEYGYQVSDNNHQTGFNLNYNIKYPSLHYDWNLDLDKYKFSFGYQSMFYRFSPGTLAPLPSSSLPAQKLDTENGWENSIYFADAFTLNGKLDIMAGLRFSLYDRFGPGKIYQYQQGQPLETYTRTDTIFVKAGSVMKQYYGLEPRLSIRYPFDDFSSLKFGYNRMFQYTNLISSTASVAPVDIWQLCNTYIKPQISNQVSMGYFRQLKNSKYQVSVESFYKRVENILDYKDGANLILNPALETAILVGHGKSYGIEFSATKIVGKLSGSFNYTYSRSLRQINDGPLSSEQINNGKYYPSNYDQPHVLNLNWRIDLTKRIFFSGLFTYHTGRPVSVPQSAYYIQGVIISNFSERNQFRIPDYHRLDLALVIESNFKRKKPWSGSWIVSAYNVYARRNAYSVFFAPDSNGELQAYKLSVIGTVIPSITYSFKF
jgi:hypothetical protein